MLSTNRVKILYSYNKTGYEADVWHREIAACSSGAATFIPFNHGEYLAPDRYWRAQLLDNLYFARDAGLMRLYSAFERTLEAHGIDAIVVDCAPPYHPDYLRTQRTFKVLRVADGPVSAYDRDFAYAHAYDLVLYHSPAYSRDMDMAAKLAYCGVRRAALWPLWLFDAAFRERPVPWVGASQGERDVDVVFVGALHVTKMKTLARLKKTFGRRCRIHGLAGFKKNAYFNVRYHWPGWVRPLDGHSYVPLYQRSRIGVNVHNRGEYTVGNFRLFELAANGVLQISDGGRHLTTFFEPEREVVPYDDDDGLIDRVTYFLSHPEEGVEIAERAYARVVRDHRIGTRMEQLAALIHDGIASGQSRHAVHVAGHS